MHVLLLATSGSRGDVDPLGGRAVQVRARGAAALVAAPVDAVAAVAERYEARGADGGWL